jgi:hypothetical protein
MRSTLQVYCCYVNWNSVPACAIMAFKWLISRQMTSRKKERRENCFIFVCDAVVYCSGAVVVYCQDLKLHGDHCSAVPV